MEFSEHFLARMLGATRVLQTSGPAAATAAIRSTLQAASAASPPCASKTSADRSPSTLRPGVSSDRNPAAADNPNVTPESVADIFGRFRKSFWRSEEGASARQPVADVEMDADVDLEGKGRFLAASCTNHAGTRAYKVYVPSSYNGQALPLIVMLHGCKQNPDDFAAGTRMNAIAEQSNCLVVYPAQAHAANGSNCWNWFKADDQRRNRGEPSIIADITRDVIRKYHIDPSRVYVAGLSAGGAMAAIMGATYPELYAAVGIHSGLPVGAAYDLPSAFAAMKNGTSTRELRKARRRPIPVIVFHGDRDMTVHPRNGEQALAQCIQQDEPRVTVKKGRVPHGRAYTRAVQHDCDGKAIAEHWIVHGAGHAWSGGSRNGSYTDPKGPNAAQEMLRFFYTHTCHQKFPVTDLEADALER
jgi:poly(hydroxyalkanoate) depolymerase family esterase